VIAGFVAGVPIALAAAIVGMPSLSPRHIIVHYPCSFNHC
jgi:hypothetical protein